MKLRTDFIIQNRTSIKLGFLALFLTIFTITSHGQQSFKFHVGPSFATNDFGDDDLEDDDAGGAGIGLSAGIEMLYPINETGFALIGGIDVSFNPLKGEYKEDIEDRNPNFDITFLNYINVPISAGLYYQFSPDANISLFGNASLAFNFLKVTDFVFEQENNEVEFKYGITNNLGVKFGAGVILNKGTTIAVNVFNLGEHDLDIEREQPGAADQKIDGDQKVNFVTLTLGFSLK